MGRFQCPGMNPAHFKPGDIQLHNCIHCGVEIEFWKDDIKIRCAACGQVNFNPNLGNTCLVWCKSAAACVGNADIYDWIKHNAQKEKEQMHEKKDY